MKNNLTLPRLLLALLLTASLIVALGCGSPEPESDESVETEPAEEPEAPEGSDDDEAIVSVIDWQHITNMRSIVSDFARLEWRFSTIEEGTESEPTHVRYTYEGHEVVDGEETDKITLTIGDEDWTIWLDGDGNPKQTASGQEIIPGQMGQNMGRAMLTMVAAPFSMTQVFPVRDVLRGGRDGWSFDELSRSTETFGDLTAEVVRLRLTARPPAVAEGEQINLIWAVADFSDFQMLVEWNVVDGEDGEHAFIMVIENLERR